MMVAYRTKERAIFLLGFAKNERENISPPELVALRELAKVWLHATERQIATAIAEDIMQEVRDEEDNQDEST